LTSSRNRFYDQQHQQQQQQPTIANSCLTDYIDILQSVGRLQSDILYISIKNKLQTAKDFLLPRSTITDSLGILFIYRQNSGNTFGLGESVSLLLLTIYSTKAIILLRRNK